MKARDVMTSHVITVGPELDVRAVANTLVANGISAAPVVAIDGSLLGIISEGDLMCRAVSGAERKRSWWLETFSSAEQLMAEFVKAHGRKAKDVMTRQVISVDPDTSLQEIANLLEKHGIKRVPVVAKGKLIGIVSRADLVQALLRAQQASQQSAEAKLSQGDAVARLKSEPWWPGNVNVVIDNGAVELWGVVESQVQKDAIRVALETIPGVRTISNKIYVQAHIPRAM